MLPNGAVSLAGFGDGSYEVRVAKEHDKYVSFRCCANQSGKVVVALCLETNSLIPILPNLILRVMERAAIECREISSADGSSWSSQIF